MNKYKVVNYYDFFKILYLVDGESLQKPLYKQDNFQNYKKYHIT